MKILIFRIKEFKKKLRIKYPSEKYWRNWKERKQKFFKIKCISIFNFLRCEETFSTFRFHFWIIFSNINSFFYDFVTFFMLFWNTLYTCRRIRGTVRLCYLVICAWPAWRTSSRSHFQRWAWTKRDKKVNFVRRDDRKNTEEYTTTGKTKRM